MFQMVKETWIQLPWMVRFYKILKKDFIVKFSRKWSKNLHKIWLDFMVKFATDFATKKKKCAINIRKYCTRPCLKECKHFWSKEGKILRRKRLILLVCFLFFIPLAHLGMPEHKITIYSPKKTFFSLRKKNFREVNNFY